ncbi:MAG: homocysteine S-methyltransferase family protein [Geminicoccaceae bacterium]
MARYRHALPQVSGGLFLTDGGLETTLVFHDGRELPHFAAFDLLKDREGRDRLIDYFAEYTAIARMHGLGFILESATWRASRDWGERLGYSTEQLRHANRTSIELLANVRHQLADISRVVISGCLGPKGDGYDPGHPMTTNEAADYHWEQIATLAETEADMITAITMTNAPEAVGITRAAADQGMPVAISFTVETDGRLPTGQPLAEAIDQVDGETGSTPAYFMINCAHPNHFWHVLDSRAGWTRRIWGLRANASKMSHAELDQAEQLDDGDPVELGQQYVALRDLLPSLNVLGGCCGTDHRHIAAIADAWMHDLAKAS